MSEERDPAKLADEMDKQAQDMEERADELGSEVADVRQDWQRKQRTESVPGANPPDLGEDAEDSESAEEDASHERSPAPEAPPEEESPSSSEMASEGSAGPPADSGSDDSDGD